MTIHNQTNNSSTKRASYLHRLLREPLLHFLLAGAMLFAAYAWLNRDADNLAGSAERTVHITASDVEWMKQTWARQWQRPPSEDELRGMVTDYIKEDLLAREARALGLDENDTVVRRRLAQKMEFMVQDTSQLAEPGDDELRRFYQTHSAQFQIPARISFQHIYFNSDVRGARTEADARAALQQLSQPGTAANATESGDRFLAQYEFMNADELAVAGVLGEDFARQVFILDAGSWQGPVESGFGLHLVRVDSRQPAQPRDFESVKTEVLALWRQQHEQQGREQYFAALLKKYDLVVDESVRPLLGALMPAPESTP